MKFVDKKHFNVKKIESSALFLKEKESLELFHSKINYKRDMNLIRISFVHLNLC